MITVTTLIPTCIYPKYRELKNVNTMQQSTPSLTKLFLSVTLTFSLSISYGQNLAANWQEELSIALEQFLECTTTNSNNDECRKFSGKSLNTLYAISDFYSEELGREYFVNEIAALVNNNKKWTLLGKAYEQEALTKAQAYANSKKAAIAVYRDAAGVGMHVALILPGDLAASGSWGFQVPNSASFFTNNPQKSFLNKSLSYAFAKNQIKDVVLYGREY